MNSGERFSGWIVAALVGGTFLSLLLLEWLWPLQRSVEAKFRSNARNLVVAGLSAATVRLAELPVALPLAMAETLHRVSASQELTVEAAVTGSRDKVVEAMLLDPLAGRIDYDELGTMTDELLDATRRWLPQFALA